MRTVGQHLDALTTAASDLSNEIEKLVTGLTDEQLLWRPGRNRWGIAECLEHLIATGEAYHPPIRAQLLGAWHDPFMEDEPYEPTWFGRRFIRARGPNGGALKAPGRLVPARVRADASMRFAAQQRELLELLADARQVDVRDLRIRSPQNRLISLRLGEAFEFLVVHQRRHVAQAKRVAVSTGFAAQARVARSTSLDPRAA